MSRLSSKDKAVLKKMAEDNERYMAMRKRSDMVKKAKGKQAGLEDFTIAEAQVEE